jgi:hypothetical protein
MKLFHGFPFPKWIERLQDDSWPVRNRMQLDERKSNRGNAAGRSTGGRREWAHRTLPVDQPKGATMSEVAKLKKQNKQLKALLKNAVQLLNRYKDLLQRAAPQPAKKKKAAKRTPAKKSRA